MPGRLREEIKQTRPFRSLEEEALLNLARTLERVLEPMHALLKSHGISRTQYNVLRILRGAGKDGLPCGEVAARMVNHDPDVTRLLERMENAGLVSRRREAADRRVIRTRITKPGLKVLEKLDRPTEEALRVSLGHMRQEELETLIALLEKARGASD